VRASNAQDISETSEVPPSAIPVAMIAEGMIAKSQSVGSC
jgi:hypothetical protein